MRATRDWIKELWAKSAEAKYDAAWETCNACVNLALRSRVRTPAPDGQDLGRLLLPHVQACEPWARDLENKHYRPTKWYVLGDLCAAHGADEAAISYFELALETRAFSEALETDRVQSLLSLASLHHQRGNHERSRKLLAGIQIDIELTSDPARDELAYRCRIAAATEAASVGELSTAEQCYVDIEKAQQARFGYISGRTILATTRLAAVLRRRGRWEEAIELHKRVLVCYRELLGECHTITLEAAEELARNLQMMGRFRRAGELYVMSIDKKKRKLGPRHPSTGASMAKYAGLCDIQGDFKTADRYYQEAREIFEQTLGRTHPLYLATLENEALSYRSRSQFEASEAQDEALKTAKQIYEDVIRLKVFANQLYEHKDVLSTRAKLSQMFEAHEYFRARMKQRLLTFEKTPSTFPTSEHASRLPDHQSVGQG